MVQIVGIDESKVKETTCKSCASRLRYTLSETIQGTWSDYSGDSGYYWYICCPKCSERVEVDRY